MPSSTLASVTADSLLTNMSVSYVQELDNMAHHRVFPVIPVDEQTGRYYEFNRGDILRIDAGIREPGTVANRKRVGITQPTYSCRQDALDMALPDEERTTKDSPLADDQATTEIVVHDVMMLREQQWQSTYMNSASIPWDNSYNGGTSAFVQWDQASNVAIVANLLEWIEDVKLASGRRPNKVVIASDVWRRVLTDTTLLARVTGSSDRPITRQWFASVIDVDEVIVPDAVTNTAAEGATVANSFILSNTVGIFYAEPRPNIRRPSAGYTFSWTQYDNVRREVGASGAPAVLRMRDDLSEADIFRAKSFKAFEVVASSAGALAYNVLATP